MMCYAVYYFSSLNRKESFQSRLRNRALTTAKYLIEITEINQDLMKRIDENTVLSLQDKSVAVFNYLNEIIYENSDLPEDTLTITKDILDLARIKGEHFFKMGKRDALSIQYTDEFNRYVIVVAAYDRVGLEQLSDLRLILVSSFIAGLIITVIIGYYFSIRLVQPIKGIIDEVNDISSHNLTKRIQAGEKHDELNQLAETFNQLLDRLQESFEIQRRFISNASHELSTPLTSITSQIGITLQKERGPEEYRAVLESVYSDVKQMGQLTRSLLEIAQTGSHGAIELRKVRIDEMLMKISSELKKINPSYVAHLDFDEFPENDGDLLVFGNADLLSSALKNLIANACKFSYTNEAIVRLTFQPSKLYITISDRGIVIPAEELNNIFQPFYRADNAKGKEGFGLGLALANRIIRLHKGRIEVSSSEESGTTFEVCLPTVDNEAQLA